jgi:hypothetical protein
MKRRTLQMLKEVDNVFASKPSDLPCRRCPLFRSERRKKPTHMWAYYVASTVVAGATLLTLSTLI